MQYKLDMPFYKEELLRLKAGDTVLLSGEMYTARDAAHKRMVELLQQGKPLPFTLSGSCIYYAGPSPAKPGTATGSIGPTTSGRMDAYTPLLLKHGLYAMIGKGARSPEVMQAIQNYKGVYFGFVGGAAALAASCVEKSELVAWEDLGSEAVRRLTVRDFPVTVLADSAGQDWYALGQQAYKDFIHKKPDNAL